MKNMNENKSKSAPSIFVPVPRKGGDMTDREIDQILNDNIEKMTGRMQPALDPDDYNEDGSAK